MLAASAAGCDVGQPFAFVAGDSPVVLEPHAVTASAAATTSAHVNSNFLIWEYYALLRLRGDRLRLFKVDRTGEERLTKDQCADTCIAESTYAIKIGDATSNAELY